VSDVVRELIISGLAKEKEKDQNAGAGVAGGEVVARLDKLGEQLELILEQKQATEGPQILRTALGLEEMETHILSALTAVAKEAEQSNNLEKLTTKALRAALGAQFYARLAASGANDLTSIWAENIIITP
jgi:hypothetical protein